MPRPKTREFGSEKTILKYFEYEGHAVLVPETLGTTVGDKKIVKAGTPFPANDATCIGLLLHDYDVTFGDVEGTAVYAGSIDNKKLTENGITVDSTAKSACPRLTFFD